MSNVWKFLLSFAIFVAVCAAGLGWFVGNEVEKELNQAVTDTPGLQLSYADCSVNILDQFVSLTDVEVTLPQGQNFRAERIDILAYDQINPLPHFARAKATNLSISATPENFGALAESMQAMGITALTGNAVLDYEYAPDTFSLKLKTMSLDDAKLGYIHLSGEADQLDIINPRMEQLLGLRIKNATLRFTDANFMNMLVTDWAARMHISKDETVNRISNELAGLAKYAGKQENRPAENVLLGLKRFLTDPGTMTATATPAQPVPMLYFFMGRDIMENLRLLDMRIETDSNDDI